MVPNIFIADLSIGGSITKVLNLCYFLDRLVLQRKGGKKNKFSVTLRKTLIYIFIHFCCCKAEFISCSECNLADDIRLIRTRSKTNFSYFMEFLYMDLSECVYICMCVEALAISIRVLCKILYNNIKWTSFNSLLT